MTMIVVMELMKENSVMPNIKHVHHKSLRVKISNVFVINIDVMEKMIAVIVPMRLDAARKKIVHVLLVNLLVPVVNALIIIWYVIRWPIVQMNQMNHCIVM